jgi:hypothetical protein
MNASWRRSLVCSLGLASAFACTFKAGDYKVVPASVAGFGGTSSGGLSSGGTSAGGNTSSAEGGAAGESTGCTLNTAKPLALLSSDDLYQQTVDRFTLVAGVGEVFALAFVTVPNGPLMQTHALIRTIADANQGALRGIADMTMPGTFLFGGAWATATEVDIVGADARGIVQLTIPINAAGNPDLSNKSNLIVTSLNTPADCAQTVHALRISRNGTSLSFVATCVPDPTKPTSYSLWLNTPALTLTTQIGTTGVTTDNAVRAFVRNGPSGATSNLILVGLDETPASDFRTGASPAELKAVSALTMSTEAGWVQEVFVSGVPDADGGTFMTVAKSHAQTSNYVPAEIWAGQIASNAYGSLTAVPPTQLKLVASYTTAADVFFPQEWTIRGSSVYVAAEDQLAQHNLELWTLDALGNTLSPSFPIYSSSDSGDVPSDVRISQLTVADVVAWVETSASVGTAIYGTSISCP